MTTTGALPPRARGTARWCRRGLRGLVRDDHQGVVAAARTDDDRVPAAGPQVLGDVELLPLTAVQAAAQHRPAVDRHADRAQARLAVGDPEPVLGGGDVAERLDERAALAAPDLGDDRVAHRLVAGDV